MKPSISLAICCVVLLLSATVESARAATVDYSALPTGTIATPFDSGGITVTTAGTLVNDGSVAGLGGLGVLGGFTVGGLDIIDGTEAVTFAFDAGSATSVSIVSRVQKGVPPDSNFKVEAFGANGDSLGTQESSILGAINLDISALFGGVPLSSFVIEGDGPGKGGVNIQKVSFTPDAFVNPVPEPPSLGLLSAGLFAATVAARRRVIAG